ncbi:ABC transporter related [Bradyrhizobium sp. ORS 375]|uniref:ATP-binding cassette domain-containing protein n=1 Tax=Bradyrhizobium sp. (strain ORS 375) TaxID=566679 RepID=UPI00024058F6|nr:ATP-binding cassette domain-containing protein [Bradyrhizobium sp. ORS 375]CCD94546.1 ABC transporter related [Bradyrhizobium sp. ORS 375]
MSLIATKDLCLTRAERIFADLNFSIARGDRLGLVAANGRGKSSLLRIMAGDDEATSGTITRARGLVIGFAPQDPPERLLPLTSREAVRDALPAETAEVDAWRVDVMLDSLAMDEALRTRSMGSLSGGWQRVVLLARAAIAEPDLLLLDEPTNHLDIGRIGILQRFLTALPRDCAIVAASHDRAFLDDVTSRTLFLRPEGSIDFALSHSGAVRALQERDAACDRRFDNDMRRVRGLRQQAAKLKNIGVNSGSDLLVTKTRQLCERADRLEERARPGRQDRSAGLIRLTNSGTHAKALVTIDDAAIATPDGRLLFRTGRLWIEKGDRVALLGANGSGKTRLVETLRQALAVPTADIKGAASLKLGHCDQALSRLDAFATPMDAIKRSSNLTDQHARAQLAGAGIGIIAQSAPLACLSGGQRARLAMLLLRLSEPNFYLLDEPTNHLDIEGQDMLAGELVQQGAACLLVSHDRAFVQSVATRTWVIQGKRLVEIDDPGPAFKRLMAG